MMVLLTDFGPTLWMDYVSLFVATGSQILRLLGASWTAALCCPRYFTTSTISTASSHRTGSPSLASWQAAARRRPKRHLPCTHRSSWVSSLMFPQVSPSSLQPPNARNSWPTCTRNTLTLAKLSPSDAGSSAGKAGFFHTTCALFARQHATQKIRAQVE